MISVTRVMSSQAYVFKINHSFSKQLVTRSFFLNANDIYDCMLYQIYISNVLHPTPTAEKTLLQLEFKQRFWFCALNNDGKLGQKLKNPHLYRKTTLGQPRNQNLTIYYKFIIIKLNLRSHNLLCTTMDGTTNDLVRDSKVI